MQNNEKKEKKLMKKLLVLLLILMMSFTMFACGNDDTPADDQQNPVAGDQQNGEDEQKQDGETDEPDKLNPDELIMGEDAVGSEDDLMAEYDFGIKADSDFAMMSTIAKVDYKNLSAHVSTMEEMLSAGTDKVFGGGYDIFGDYEEDTIDTIDKLAYAVGMENSESEASYVEAGVYHDSVYDKHFQYTVYASENVDEFSSAAIEAALKEIKDAYGITVSQKTAEKAVKKVLETVAATEDYYSLYEEKEVSGSGYTEMITFSIDGFCNEDGSSGYYFAVERERCYE